MRRLCWDLGARGLMSARAELEPHGQAIERCRDRLAGLCVELAVTGVRSSMHTRGAARPRDGGRPAHDATRAALRRAYRFTQIDGLRQIAAQLRDVQMAVRDQQHRHVGIPGSVASRMTRLARELGRDVVKVTHIVERVMTSTAAPS